VTPFLDSLARESASSQRMFVHSPYTARSRAQLFGGSLDPRPGQRTWIDDFQDLGYRVAHFSGQDDSFADSEPLLGIERADVFYDARADTALRTSRSTNPASLQVSWKVLLRRVASFLAEPRDEPLFLYVNIVDTHYPYHHAELDSLVPGTPVDRSGIRSRNREQVWRTYLNAVANVDLSARELVSAFRTAIEGAPHAIVVTGDHGQSFYEDGFLGHGHRLDRRQTQVPLIVHGLGGLWPEPLGAADLRGMLLRSLGQPGATRPEFRPDPERRLLQYMPNLERPERIAWRSADDAVVYDFAAGTAHREDGTRVALDDPEVTALIRAWEALRVAGIGR
jgi:arylsulfatase A-like enzyme